MASHHIHMSLQRARRRPRALSCLAASSAAASGLSALAGAVALWVGAERWGPHGGGACAAAIIVVAALASAAAGRRVGLALREMAQAARRAAEGDLGVQVPRGPGSEVAELGAALSLLVAQAGGARLREPDQRSGDWP